MKAELRDLIALYQSWLLLPDPSPVLVSLAAVAANFGPGKPVWLQLIGPPSSGKSEILQSLSGIPKIFPVSDLTVAGLLSGSKKSERSRDSTGGLLEEVDDFGVLVAKDFGSVLNMRADSRRSLLMALREIYDGTWVRRLGNDGGRAFMWKGKIGFIAAATPSIDSHHAMMSLMGERWVYCRMSPIDGEEQAHRALENIQVDDAKSKEIAEAVAKFFHGLDLDQPPPQSTEPEKRWLIALATLVSTCRSATERDNYTREISITPEAERPARLVKVLDLLRAGSVKIGMERCEIWPLIEKVAFDSLPEARARILNFLQDRGDQLPDLYEVAKATGCSASTTRRHLEDFDHYGVLERRKGGPHRGDEYLLSEWAQGKLKSILAVPGKSTEGGVPSLPEKSHSALVAGEHVTRTRSSGDRSDISGTSESEIQHALGKSEV